MRDVFPGNPDTIADFDRRRTPPKAGWGSNALKAFVYMVHFGVAIAVASLVVAFIGYSGVGLARGSVSPGSEIFRSRLFGPEAARAESYLPHLLLVWAIACGVLHRVSRSVGGSLARLTRRSEILVVRCLNRVGFAACLGVYLLALARVWVETAPLRGDAKPPDDATEYASLLGNIPWSDAIGYYGGGRSLLDIGKIDDWNERQPLNTALLAVRLGLTDLDLRAATLLQVILLAVATFLASRTLGARLGPWSAIATTALIFAFGRMFFASTLSETLGLSLGALSLGLLFRALADRDGYAAAAGLGALSLGMSARPGAMFVAPCLFAAFFAGRCVLGRGRLKPAVTAIVLAIMGAACTPLVNAVYGTGAGMSGANFAYYAAGLAMGGGWVDAQDRYAEELSKLPSERQKAGFLYGRAAALVRADPRPFVAGLLRGERAFIRDIVPVLSRLSFFDAPLSRYGEPILLAIGVVLFLYRNTAGLIFWSAAWCGLLLSAPLIFTGAGWRTSAPAWPLMAAFVSLGVAVERPLATARGSARFRMWRDAAWLCVVCLAVLAVAGPRMLQAIAPRAPVQGCVLTNERGPLLVTRNVAREPAVMVSRAEPKPWGTARLPALDFRVYRRLLRDSGNEDGATLMNPPEDSFVIFDAYDYGAHRIRQLIGPAELLSVTTPWMWMRVEPFDHYFQHVVEFGPFAGCQARTNRD